MAADSAGSVSMQLKLDKSDLKSQIKSVVGDVVAEIKKDVSAQTSSIAKDVTTAQKSITRETKAATSSMNDQIGSMTKLTGVAKGLLRTLGITMSIAGILAFGKACVDLGSDLQEVQNVVDVVYGEMTEDVNDFASAAMKSYGMSETIAKQYMGTLGSMSKAFGFTTAEAYEQSAELTALAGDMASFYNKSTEETFNALKAVYSGETEVLKQYGVVMSETALNEYALSQGIGKTVKEMSEQEKVSLRLAFVQDRLSAASGDFQRTSGGWANQVRVLSLQFDAFKASIGQGLINVLTPVVQWLNAIMEAANGAAKAFANFTATITGGNQDIFAGIADSTAAAADSAQDLNEGVAAAGGSAKKAMKQLAGFDKLNILSNQSSGGGGGGGGKSSISSSETDKATQSENKLNEALSTTKALLKDIGTSFMEGFNSSYNDQYAQDIKEDIESIGSTIKRIFTDPEVTNAANSCTRSWARAFGSVTGTVATVTLGVTKAVTGSIDKFLTDNEEPIKDHMVTMFNLSGREADAITSLSTSVSNIFQAVFDSGNLETAGANIAGVFFDITSTITEFKQALNTGFLEGFAEAFRTFESDISTACVNISDAIATFTEPFKEAFDAARQNFEASGIADKAREVGQAIGDTIGTIVRGFNTLYSVIKPLIQVVASFLAKYGATFFAKLVTIFKVVLSVIKAIFTAAKGVVEVLIGIFSGDWGMVTQGFEDIIGSITGLFSDLLEDFRGYFTDLLDIFQWDQIVEGIYAVWEGVASWFDETVCQPIIEFFGPILDIVGELFNTLWLIIVGIWMAASDWFNDHVIQPIVVFFSPIVATVSGFFSNLWSYIKDVWNSVATWFDDNVTQPITNFFEDVWTNVSGFFSNLWSDICAVWQGAADWFTENVTEPIGSAFEGIESVVRGAFNGLLGSIEGALNSILSGLNTFIRRLNGFGQNAASALGVDYTPLPEFNDVSIPRLATGGFVEANTPQLAVIGDNRHQGEFVAPEDKLQASVSAAMLSMMPQMAQMMVSALNRCNLAGTGGDITLHNVIDLDGEIIYENQEKIKRTRNKRSGGNLDG